MIKRTFIMIFLLNTTIANAEEMNDIEHHLFCSMFAYQNLKQQILSGNIDLSEEIQQLDMVGVLRGKAQQLVLEEYGSGMSHYANARNKSLQIYNEEMKRGQKLNPKEQEKWGYDLGVKCGELFAKVFYTKEDLERSKKGMEKLNEVLKDKNK